MVNVFSTTFVLDSIRESDLNALQHVTQSVDKIITTLGKKSEYIFLIRQLTNVKDPEQYTPLIKKLLLMVKDLVTDQCVFLQIEFLVRLLCNTKTPGDYQMGNCRFELVSFGDTHVYLTSNMVIEIPNIKGYDITAVENLSFHMLENGIGGQVSVRAEPTNLVIPSTTSTNDEEWVMSFNKLGVSLKIEEGELEGVTIFGSDPRSFMINLNTITGSYLKDQGVAHGVIHVISNTHYDNSTTPVRDALMSIPLWNDKEMWCMTYSKGISTVNIEENGYQLDYRLKDTNDIAPIHNNICAILHRWAEANIDQ